jgi:excisionase family DNA binding protein
VSERLLTLPDAAEQLACSLATLKRRIRAGQLPVFRDGRLIRVRQQDLDHYIQRRIRLPTEPAQTTKPIETEPLTPGRKLFDLPDLLT